MTNPNDLLNEKRGYLHEGNKFIPINGLTKREFFALQAIQCFSFDESEVKHLQKGARLNHKLVAKFCVGFADALIEALNGR